MAATMMEAPSGASGRPRGGPRRGPERLVSLLSSGDSPLSAAEAAELVARWLEVAVDIGERPSTAQACRCPRRLEFERKHCFLCGRRIEEAS